MLKDLSKVIREVRSRVKVRFKCLDFPMLQFSHLQDIESLLVKKRPLTILFTTKQRTYFNLTIPEAPHTAFLRLDPRPLRCCGTVGV